jgi:hypothetical protein
VWVLLSTLLLYQYWLPVAAGGSDVGVAATEGALPAAAMLDGQACLKLLPVDLL